MKFDKKTNCKFRNKKRTTSSDIDSYTIDMKVIFDSF